MGFLTNYIHKKECNNNTMYFQFWLQKLKIISFYKWVVLKKLNISILKPVGFEMKLAGFYHSTILGVQQILERFVESEILTPEESTLCFLNLQISRHRSILAFRTIVEFNCLNPVMSETHCDKDEALEGYFSIFTTILQERTFLLDYNSRYSLQDDFDVFEQSGLNVDQTRKHYILDALCESSQGSVFSNVLAGEKEKKSSVTPTVETVPETGGATALSSSALKPTVELDSLISSVRDMLPFLGEGFVEKCLEHYQFKVEEVVNAILEGNLAPHLASLDQSLERQVVEPKLVPAPRCIYDNDEFDVNSRDEIDLSRIHRGKKNKYGNAMKLLDDKTDINSMRDRFSALGIVSDIEVMVGEEREYEVLYC